MRPRKVLPRRRTGYPRLLHKIRVPGDRPGGDRPRPRRLRLDRIDKLRHRGRDPRGDHIPVPPGEGLRPGLRYRQRHPRRRGDRGRRHPPGGRPGEADVGPRQRSHRRRGEEDYDGPPGGRDIGLDADDGLKERRIRDDLGRPRGTSPNAYKPYRYIRQAQVHYGGIQFWHVNQQACIEDWSAPTPEGSTWAAFREARSSTTTWATSPPSFR
ncbi:MAG: hypothetical protein METHAR1v1_1240008 [Methanothrix sp.]|nr:MAG: hypothetical protein METHAR1v1_1240008 [Methanothrix sp.]